MEERGSYDDTGYGAPSQGTPPPGYRYTAPMPPAVKPKRTTPLWVAIVAGVGGLVFGAAIGSGGKTDTTATTAATTTVGAPAAGGAGSATTQTAAAPAAVPAATTTQAAPAPAKPAKTVVLTTSGNGIKQTKTFTTGADWSVTYTFDCSNFGMKGNFQLSTESDFTVLANALATKGADTTYQHDNAGKHSLSVNSECDWTLKVTDGDAG